MNRMIRRRLVLCLLCVSLVMAGVLLEACRPHITASTDPQDTDLAPFETGVVRGEGFSIAPDVRVFTLFAYLNGPAGWVEENGPAFSPARARLRADLEARMAALDPTLVARWRDYYARHKQISYRYLYYTLTLGAPPRFNYITRVEEMKYPEIVQSLDGFNQVLAEFYREAGIEELYNQTYRDVMLAEVRQYDLQRIANQVAYVYGYLRLDRTQLPAFDVVIIPAPFNSHWDANALSYSTRLYIVEGPEANDYGLNIHEYLHMLMDSLIPADFAGQQRELNAIFQANREAPYVGSYQELHTYVEENLVRALDHRMRVHLEPARRINEERALQDEVANGLVLTDDFYTALGKYEQDPAESMQEYIVKMLQVVSS